MLKDPVFNRRAIFTALHAYFDEASLLKVIAAWDNFCLNGQPSVQRFLAELCQSEALKQKRADMLRSILQALSLPASQLLPDPAPSVQAQAPAQTAAATPRFDLAFNALLQRLLFSCPASEESAMRKNLLQHSQCLRLGDSLLQELNSCLISNNAISVSCRDTQQLRQVLNCAYVELCERIGPVEADIALSQSASAVQMQQPELGRLIAQLL